MENEKFDEFLKGIPEGVTMPLESHEDIGLVQESQNIINALDVLKEHGDTTKETQIGLLPKIKEVIASLRELQVKGDTEAIRSGIVRLVAERDRIELMVN